MQTTFQASDSGQAVIQNTAAVGTEKLVVTLHPEHDSAIDIQIREDSGGQDLVSSSMTINRSSLQQLVQWLRDQGAID